MARKQKTSKENKEMSNLKGWEKKYLQQAKKYGHLESGNTRDSNRR